MSEMLTATKRRKQYGQRQEVHTVQPCMLGKNRNDNEWTKTVGGKPDEVDWSLTVKGF